MISHVSVAASRLIHFSPPCPWGSRPRPIICRRFAAWSMAPCRVSWGSRPRLWVFRRFAAGSTF